MERWQHLVGQLEESDILTEDRAEVRVRREILDESLERIGDRRGTKPSTVSVLNSRAESHVESVREGLRLYDVYFNGSSDVRPGDRLWHLPDGWTETAHSYVQRDEVSVAIYQLPDDSFVTVKQKVTGPTEDQYYTIETTGETYSVTPVDIDWDAFHAELPISTTQEFRNFVEGRYKQAVTNAVNQWLFEQLAHIDGADLQFEPASLEISSVGFVEKLLDWSQVPGPDDDISLEERDREHPGLVVNHAIRFVDEKGGYEDAVLSFPKSVQKGLDAATPGRFLLGFHHELTD